MAGSYHLVVLAGTAGAGRMAPPTSTRISAETCSATRFNRECWFGTKPATRTDPRRHTEYTSSEMDAGSGCTPPYT